MPRVGFVVGHDTGNPGSTAKGNIDWYERTHNDASASAHIFVDDKVIYECIPLLTGTPEKAWHVLYDRPLDNEIYGDDANDIAAGVEYCYGKNIDADEAYARYIWVIAYIFYKFGCNAATDLIGHMILDPSRKTDPQSGLHASGRSYDQLLKDVVDEFLDCTGQATLDGGEIMKLQHQWQWDMMAEALDELHKEGFLTSPDWAAKAKNKSLTTDEVVFVNLILTQRHLLGRKG